MEASKEQPRLRATTGANAHGDDKQRQHGSCCTVIDDEPTKIHSSHCVREIKDAEWKSRSEWSWKNRLCI